MGLFLKSAESLYIRSTLFFIFQKWRPRILADPKIIKFSQVNKMNGFSGAFLLVLTKIIKGINIGKV